MNNVNYKYYRDIPSKQYFYQQHKSLIISIIIKLQNYSKKSTIVSLKKYYRFEKKVLSFLRKSTIISMKKYYQVF